jgi:fatty-acyl-CoA synthase
LPGQQIRFRDQETGALLAAGKTGLAEIHGRVSPGYFGKSIAVNDSAFTPDGYYRTGDLGYLDPDGAFVFVGRASEMIKRAGINVSPAEVEDVLLRFEGVTAAAVVGVSDPQRDEAIVAYVTGRDGTVDTDGLRAHCRAFLSKYKLPDHFQIVDRLPLTATGKLQRKLVREMAAALVAADRQGGLE